MPIRRLPPEVAGKIAAGEVVERPASVVKELVENSIDAGATNVQIEIREGGRRLIRVADDGDGIPSEEVPLAFARHATSKLSYVEDLDRIATLGFRGEALASIAAVSQVTILTRPRSQTVGQFLRVAGGEIVKQEGRGSPAGTVLTVEHLFRNVPARLKFLRQPQTETGHIHTVVTHYALAYPDIRFHLTTDGRQAFQSMGSGKLYDVLIAVYGLEVAEQMLEVKEVEDPEKVERESSSNSSLAVLGYTSTPALHRANRSYLTFFVNRRWIQERSLAHAVAQAYHTLLPIGRHPLAVILLEVDPAEVDVNVHPTKREVKFRDGRRVFSTVQRVVRRTLIEGAPVQSLTQRPQTWPTPDWERRQALLSTVERETTSTQLAMEIYRTDPAGEPQPVGPVRLPLLRVVGQVGQTYIVAEGPQGMYLIDQHAAHERVLYEQMMVAHDRRDVASQALLEPLSLDLDPLLAGTMAEHLATLNEVGFVLEPFGGTSYLLRAVPSIVVVPDVRAAVVDILEILRQGDDLLATRSEQRLIAAVCKRAAIKAGQTLSADEMQQLVRQLEQCESPRTCPHGRPTVLHFSVEQLEKEFGRS
ncbi:MAG TPA: DNA mismatch repair endonuclease MutL [Anaerolineae bacterium]|nr:DNA mismatch repair endonuclease MutL [Anaerolineae bacterium]